jgi:hypothetical protein
MSNLFEKADQSAMTRAMFGQHAIHIPMWLIAQEGEATTFVVATRSSELMFGCVRTHALVWGELIVRPHLVVASDEFRGSGLTHLANVGALDERWLRADTVLDPLGRLAQLRGR